MHLCAACFNLRGRLYYIVNIATTMYVAKQYSWSMVDTIDNVPTTFISINAYNVRRALSRPLLKQFFFRILVYFFYSLSRGNEASERCTQDTIYRFDNFVQYIYSIYICPTKYR